MTKSKIGFWNCDKEATNMKSRSTILQGKVSTQSLGTLVALLPRRFVPSEEQKRSGIFDSIRRVDTEP